MRIVRPPGPPVLPLYTLELGAWSLERVTNFPFMPPPPYRDVLSAQKVFSRSPAGSFHSIAPSSKVYLHLSCAAESVPSVPPHQPSQYSTKDLRVAPGASSKFHKLHVKVETPRGAGCGGGQNCFSLASLLDGCKSRCLADSQRFRVFCLPLPAQL